MRDNEEDYEGAMKRGEREMREREEERERAWPQQPQIPKSLTNSRKQHKWTSTRTNASNTPKS